VDLTKFLKYFECHSFKGSC